MRIINAIFVLFVGRLVGAGDVNLVCDEHDKHLILDLGDPYCTVTGFTVTHSQNVVLHNSWSGKNSVMFMKFYDSTLLYLPFHLFETFANLRTLDVSFTGILELTRNTFSSASNLTYLNLSYNNLTSLQTSVFIGANTLMRLDLSYNQISSLSENAFCGLHNLNKLQLGGNRLSELHKDIFKDNAFLESVNLEANELTYVEPEVFSRMRRIKEVILSNNQLLQVHPDTFTEAASLESLLLARNKLYAFQLTNKSIVHQLQLDNNHLTNLTINGTRFVRANNNNISAIFVQQASQLDTLELRGNNLSNIANITSLSALLYLDLSYNPIGPLNISTFDNLKRLRSLYLRHIGIRSLQFGMFSKQNYLEILDLSFNNLTSLNLDLFVPYLTNLKQFFIDGNALSELHGNRSLSSTFPMLQKLGVSRNRFNCSYLHHLLIPPYLAETVALHIEPDPSTEETPHIRDVSCLHPEPSNEKLQRSQDPLTRQLELLQSHAHNLELHLLFMKVFFYILGTMLLLCLVAMVALRYWKVRRSGRYERNSIVFKSDATMDTNLTLD
ncbi:leucine-rich repeat-containing G-protein coupled receptor 5 [Scaptodrosophila lebanonensis]|uniref:Leucine-rich repeat-containing G-protein coupled receptor 5 n=1 Tax=Drosophila lebanonensis TaxID=7225 RepID=A0A6J2UDJ6_DROLE|nr:leucine-rich repeat-containing G-protein coupled receptor 5 [Scaptodrosophila lebanonensis]